MDKSILYQYIDACELARETEREIEQIRRRRRETQVYALFSLEPPEAAAAA